jgi:hypothetical protein
MEILSEPTKGHKRELISSSTTPSLVEWQTSSLILNPLRYWTTQGLAGGYTDLCFDCDLSTYHRNVTSWWMYWVSLASLPRTKEAAPTLEILMQVTSQGSKGLAYIPLTSYAPSTFVQTLKKDHTKTQGAGAFVGMLSCLGAVLSFCDTNSFTSGAAQPNLRHYGSLRLCWRSSWINSKV